MKQREYRMLFCCGCDSQTKARLTDGLEIYPGNQKTVSKSFWKCDECGNYVGCHPDTRPPKPLGVIPTPELRNARMHIHSVIDPIWKEGRASRSKVYTMMRRRIGYPFHTAGVCSIDEARRIYRAAREIAEIL